MGFVDAFKKWFAQKWETAEVWLPWFLGIAATLVLVTGLLVGFLRSQSRDPAGFVEISDSDTPASSIYADETIESLKAREKEHDGFGRGNKVTREKGPAKAGIRIAGRSESGGRKQESVHSFVVALKEGLTNEEIERRTGVPVRRGRAVVITADILLRHGSAESQIRVELFPDVAPVFKMKMDAAYQVNEGMHSGYAEDDPGSRANFTTANGMVSGFIKYRGIDYRIVPDEPRGLHYIIEVRK